MVTATPHPTDCRLALELDALGPQVGDGGLDVVAGQRQLVVGRLRRVDADLGRREGEDQPPLAGVDVVPSEDVAEDGAQRLRLRGVEQDVGTGDGHGRRS